MKTPLSLLFLLFLGFAMEARSQTFNWGSEVFSDLADSKGNVLDDTFIFELGSFTGGFMPGTSNVMEWKDNWQAFDKADYNGIETPTDDGIYGYYTSSASMTDAGLSDSPDMTPGAMSFEGLDAYVWIRNSDDPSLSTEWLLARNSAWTFPTAIPGCCDNGTPIEWSTSDLTMSDIPVWGAQGDETGDGIITSPGTFTLQTATFDEPMLVPEPSVYFLKALGAALLLFRRRRNP
ncbi:MAG: PEP-CTERM sorting domain-containing protein [Luteolibacter sp.]